MIIMETTESYSNWTSPMSVDEGRPGMSVQSVVMATILGVCSVLIIASNTLILIVLHKARDCFEEMQQFVFKALAVTDFLTGIFCCTLSMLAIVFGITQSFSSTMCAIRGAACTGLTNLSALLITFACLDRFLAVIFPLRYPMLVTLRRAKIVVLVCCGVAVFNGGLSTLRGTTVSKGNLCLSDFSSERLAFRPSLVTSLLILTVTLVLTVFFNIKVMVIVSGQSRRIAALGPSDISDANTTVGNLNKDHRAHLKGLRVLIIATAAFFIAILPWNIIAASQFNSDRNIATPMARFVSSALLLSSSWANAVIFLALNRRFRRAAKQLVRESPEDSATEVTMRTYAP